MHTFIDPRVDRSPTVAKPLPRTTRQADDLTELHALCRDGRLYDVERWIASGRPLQTAQEAANGRANRLRCRSPSKQETTHSFYCYSRMDTTRTARSIVRLISHCGLADLISSRCSWTGALI